MGTADRAGAGLSPGRPDRYIARQGFAFARRPAGRRLGRRVRREGKVRNTPMNQKRSSRNRIATVVIGVAISVSIAAHAEDVFVKLPQANILAGKGAGSDRIAQVKKGEK